MAIGITFAGTILANSLTHFSSSRDRIMAVNIAREGLEAVRNIRDTNWLKFSGNRRECWNHLPQSSASDTCDANTASLLIAPDTYLVYRDINKRWRLLTQDTRDAQLFTMDIDPNTDSDGDGKKQNDADIYNPKITPALGGSDDPWGSQTDKSLFKRTITIGYLDNTDGTGSVSDNRMVVTSTVTWVTSQGTSTVELTTHLTDYLGRDNFDS